MTDKIIIEIEKLAKTYKIGDFKVPYHIIRFYDVSYGFEFLRKLKNPRDDGEKPYFLFKYLSNIVVSYSILTLLPYLHENRIQKVLKK